MDYFSAAPGLRWSGTPSPNGYSAAMGAGVRLTHTGGVRHSPKGALAERAPMSEMPDAVTWQQLGEMLRRCREDLEPRYAGRGGLTRFAEERGLNRRVAWDIENAKRDNYT